MHTDISFPNLHIYLSNVGKTVQFFGFSIAYYGIVIGCGILLSLLLAVHEAKRTGQNPDHYLDIALYGVIFGVIGARVYYVAFRWNEYKDDIRQIFNIRGGGLAIYGGVIAATIVVIVYSRKKKLSLRVVADTAFPSLLLGQAIGRWGNFFNREAFGEYTNSLFAMRLPLDAVNSENVTETMYQHLQTIDGVRYIQVHPTFLYESAWDLALLALLLICRKHKKFDGQIVLMYFCGYGLGRFFIEQLRTDQLLIPGTNVPVSMVLAGSLFLCAGALLLYGFRKLKKPAQVEEKE